MTWEEMLERFREALRAEARKRWGHIGEIEQRAGMRRGRISDVYSGRVKELPALLRALDALEIDHCDFFTRALGFHERPEDHLARLGEGAEEGDTKIVRLERATYRLEAEAPPAVGKVPDASEVEKQLAAFLRCDHREQRRRLRETRKYRTHAFAHAYVEHLGSSYYDAPDEVAELAAATLAGLIPRLPEPQSGRLDLHCWTLGIYGSARLVRGRLATTARVLHLGLGLARRHGRHRQTAELLHRASYLQRHLGQFERGLAYLGEALAWYVDLRSSRGIGKVLVGRGMLFNDMGKYPNAIASLESALEYLQDENAAAYFCSAQQELSRAALHLGDLDSAERHLGAAESIKGLQLGLSAGKLMWMRGNLAFRRRHFAQAEESLRRARRALAEYENPGQEAVVSLDLMEVLLARGKLSEAIELAREMLHFLEAFKSDRLSSQALFKLIRPAMEGRLSRATVAEARAALKAVACRGDRVVGSGA